MPARRAKRLPVDERRPLILDAALELLVERPGERPAMDAIARHAGVTKPSVYNCFGTRHDLFTALAEREEARIRQLVAGSLGGVVAVDSAEEALRTAFAAILRSVAERPSGWRLVYPLTEPRDEALTRRLRAVRAANLAMTERLCRDHLERRRAPDSARGARLLARVIAGVLDQLIELVLEDDSASPDELAAWAARVLARGEAALHG